MIIGAFRRLVLVLWVTSLAMTTTFAPTAGAATRARHRLHYPRRCGARSEFQQHDRSGSAVLA